MNQFITIQISDPLFWGYKYQVPLKYLTIATTDDIKSELHSKLYSFLTQHNLLQLRDRIPIFHIPQISGEIPSTIFACSHQHSNNCGCCSSSTLSTLVYQNNTTSSLQLSNTDNSYQNSSINTLNTTSSTLQIANTINLNPFQNSNINTSIGMTSYFD